MCICVLKLWCQTEQHVITFILNYNIASLRRISAAQIIVYTELSAPVSDQSHYV